MVFPVVGRSHQGDDVEMQRRGTQTSIDSPTTTAELSASTHMFKPISDRGWSYLTPVVGADRKASWEECDKMIKEHDKAAFEIWTDELGSLLIFAGLFSGTVTAFTVESYKWLRGDPTQAQGQSLGLITTNSAIRINMFWFLSLTLSLATVSIAILCLQWLRECRRPHPLGPRDSIKLRQIRYKGLAAWAVFDIVSALPVLLQISFILFAIGLVDLLWNLNRIIAITVSIVVASSFIFLLATTVLPTMQISLPSIFSGYPQCPYKSPQAWGFRCLVTGALWYLPLRRFSRRVGAVTNAFANLNWVEVDMYWPKLDRRKRWQKHKQHIDENLNEGVVWLNQTFMHRTAALKSVFSCLQDLSLLDVQMIVLSLIELEDEKEIFKKAMASIPPDNNDLRSNFVLCWYMSVHEKSYPEFQDQVLRLRIDVINSLGRITPRPDIRQQWLPNIYWDLYNTSIHMQETTLGQYFTCLGGLARGDQLTQETLIELWLSLGEALAQYQRDPHESRTPGLTNLAKEVADWITMQSANSADDIFLIGICLEEMTTVLTPLVETAAHLAISKVKAAIDAMNRQIETRKLQPDVAKWQKITEFSRDGEPGHSAGGGASGGARPAVGVSRRRRRERVAGQVKKIVKHIRRPARGGTLDSQRNRASIITVAAT